MHLAVVVGSVSQRDRFAALSATKFGTAPSLPAAREIARFIEAGRVILNPPPQRARTPTAR